MTATATPRVPVSRDPRVSPLSRLTASPVLRLVVKRLLMAIPIMLGVTVLTFWVLSLIPGNAAQQLLGPEATPEDIALLEQQLGLDKPGVVRYFDWLQGAVTGDLGNSLVSRQPVSEILSARLPVTAELVFLAFVVSLVLAVPVALLAAHKPGGVMDRISMMISTLGLSVANYVLALLLVLVFAVSLGWLPAIGYTPLEDGLWANLRGMILPSAAIGFPLFCYYTRFLRGDLVDQMQQEEYVTTARAKGVGSWAVLIKHAFRNSSFGLITIVGLNLGALIGGTVIIEQIFALPGIGQMLLQAINTRDFVVVQAAVVIFALVAVVANLVVDLLYAVLDPRIRYGSR
ncbi:ABC transporter permease [Geodermatophilus sabuli]|uniref:Peptide/nickel transport system permease protein n=1 Tax=Geodermatophilus sabuli TaxID=1564158 RepID=A0A285E7L9_9ACTN|nr:ABC transporter permease [Geodermatophilus sabuli]MBB3082036.1 peptide/nickel transport system permease protein [Geodermatophilus sabuli]SNX95092.1 peptide/nickel transport system permease protein [Geodermatophilus sabuli]